MKKQRLDDINDTITLKLAALNAIERLLKDQSEDFKFTGRAKNLAPLLEMHYNYVGTRNTLADALSMLHPQTDIRTFTIEHKDLHKIPDARKHLQNMMYKISNGRLTGTEGFSVPERKPIANTKIIE